MKEGAKAINMENPTGSSRVSFTLQSLTHFGAKKHWLVMHLCVGGAEGVC